MQRQCVLKRAVASIEIVWCRLRDFVDMARGGFFLSRGIIAHLRGPQLATHVCPQSA